MTSDRDACRRICDELLRHDRIVVTSHVRPDGDAIGSSIALARALTALGKAVRVICKDPVPVPITEFPGVEDVEVAGTVPPDTQAVAVLECGDLERTGLTGLEHCRVVNVDHHQGNNGYGHERWFDASYAAVGEMVFEIIEMLGVPLTAEMATHLFVAVVTDTGSFRYPGVSPRTFSIASKLVAAGADPVLTARRLYDSKSIGRLRLESAVLQTLDIQAGGRLAVLRLGETMLAETGATSDDTDGLINIPLGVKAIQASVLLKPIEGGNFRVSFRSKGDIDVAAIARTFGGGGHRNASGATIPGTFDAVRQVVLERLLPEIDARGAHGADQH